ncbi:MAG: hypothetical protein ABIJ85_02035 [bacterium]
MKRVFVGKKIKDSEIRELVIARLRTLSSNKKISIGSSGDFSRDELIERVKNNDEVGKKITEIQLQYLESLKQGILLPE